MPTIKRKVSATERLPVYADPTEYEVPHKQQVLKSPNRYRAFMNGKITIDDLDEDEIMRGQIRNKAGHFGGRKPNYVPREFLTQIQVKQREIYEQTLAPMVLKAMRTLDDVMEEKAGRYSSGPSPQHAARVAAAKLVLERALGRVPEQVQIKAEISHWERVAGEILIDVDDPKELGEL